jgi:NAD-dependent DNA ligase
LEWQNHLLYCRNSSCASKVGKRIEHFAKSLKIKGLGPATIAKLKLTDIADIYLHTKESIADALNSDKLAEKLIYEIENSKNAPLNLLLPAFSVPLIGKTASEKLSTVCEHILDITDETCGQAGLGPKSTENLLDWLEHEFPLYRELPFSFTFKRQARPTETKGIVCISGRLKTFKTKAAATEALTKAGYEVKSSLTKQVTILINESGVESAKTLKARESGVTIITNLLEFIGE